MAGKGTQSVHSGAIHDKEYGGVNSPIITSSAYNYLNEAGVVYPRYFNTPNQEVVAQKIADLENGEKALIYSSGLAAIYAAFRAFLSPGDHILLTADIYGGTQHLVQQEFGKLGISFDFVDFSEESSISAAIRPNTKMIYAETPSNPLMRLTDLEMVANLAKKHHILSMVDNTFASPINQNPINWGIDLVMHSGTKYLGGHSDLSFGVIVCSEKLFPSLKSISVNLGGNINAQTAALIERSMKTLAVRVKQQNENALYLAENLEKHPKIAKVNYPGLASHPDVELAKKQMQGFGGMLSFEIKDADIVIAEKFLRALQLIQPSVSLGGVESIINSPVKTSHSKLSDQQRIALGIGENLVRCSVGIEDKEDLWEDLKQALANLS